MAGAWHGFRRRIRQAVGRPAAPPCTTTAADAAHPTRYTVLVDDNFDYMDEDARYSVGEFDDYESAVAKCRAMVDEFLVAEYRPGMSAEELYDRYASFGDDPFISPRASATPFSAWSYARERCQEMSIVQESSGSF